MLICAENQVKRKKEQREEKKIFMHHDFKTKLIMDLTGGD